MWALVQHDLKRLLAYHSIENVGIIALGLGASMLFARAGNALWAQLAFAAALLHVANHAIFKSLLFLGAGAFERAVGSLELDRLGGLLRRMPWTGGAFLIGSMAIAGVPPLNGFASEWLTLQSLLHVAFHRPLGVALAGGVALAALVAAVVGRPRAPRHAALALIFGDALTFTVPEDLSDRSWGCLLQGLIALQEPFISSDRERTLIRALLDCGWSLTGPFDVDTFSRLAPDLFA